MCKFFCNHLNNFLPHNIFAVKMSRCQEKMSTSIILPYKELKFYNSL